MRFPISWIKDWVDIPDDLDAAKDALMKAGVEVEAVDNPSAGLDKVLVAKVLKKEPHPDADKLSVCQVDDGSGTPRQIVCGASNFKVGDLVPLATPGAILPGDFKIKKSKIRGVESLGMMCSGKELGLSEDSSGLWILDGSPVPGTPASEVLGSGETVFTVETTANRADHLSVMGLAREMGALMDLHLKDPVENIEESDTDIAESVHVSIDEDTGCSLYLARIVRGIKIGPSPDWLAKRVEACGTRSINNVVDVTNYVLFEMGQPLHAFDLGSLKSREINVRSARAGEKFTTLDGEERNLEAGDVLISDKDTAIALAGVMGGANSEVNETTTDLLIEAAVFQSKRVRQTSRRLGLVSESSYRFERGVDGQATRRALDHAAQLITRVAGGSIDSGVAQAGSPPVDPHSVHAEISGINGLLGTVMGGSTMAALLRNRGFEVTDNEDSIVVKPPAWRRDVTRPADIAEEIGQLYGVDKIESRPLPDAIAPRPDHAQWRSAWAIRDAAVELGLVEAACLTYMDPSAARAWGEFDNAIAIDNPISDEQSLLRPSLLPNLAAVVAANMKNRAGGVSLFEWGNVFNRVDGKIIETPIFAVALAGLRQDAHWNRPRADWDFFDLKGLLEDFADKFGLKVKFQNAVNIPGWAHPGQALSFRLGKTMGWLAAVHPALLKKLDTRGKTMFMLQMGDPGADALFKEYKFSQINRLPSNDRDLSCYVSNLPNLDVSVGTLLDFFKKDKATQNAKVTLREVYQGAPLPQDLKNLVFSIEYPPGEKNVTDDEINKVHEDLVQRLLGNFNDLVQVELRK